MYSARSITALISLMPDVTALKVMNSIPLARAIIKARVVLPEPGGPQKISEGSWPLDSWRLAMTLRSGLSGDMISSCPVNSSNFSGRIRSASGAEAESRLFRGGWLSVLSFDVASAVWLFSKSLLLRSLLCSIMRYDTFPDYRLSTNLEC